MRDVLVAVQAHNDATTPVIVIGFARSGMSMLCRLMCRYLELGVGTEGQGTRPDLNLQDLYAQFPDARFVHVIRDGRDVFLEIRHASVAPQNACECAESWGRTQQRIRAFQALLPQGQFHEVRYEDLTERPLETMQVLGIYLGRPLDDRESAAKLQDLQADVRPGNCANWRSAMHPRDLERFEGIAGDALVAGGYRLALQGHARRYGPVERWTWRMLGRATRLTRRDAQRDVACRVRLGASAAGRRLASVAARPDVAQLTQWATILKAYRSSGR